VRILHPAHTYTGHTFARLSEADIAAAKRGEAADDKLAAALHFARRVAETRGKVGDDDLAQLRAAGYGDAQILEIVANVAKNFLTNLINNVAQTDVDFPAITASAAA
jgi:alkylhydroperoxidase family enzyme